MRSGAGERPSPAGSRVSLALLGALVCLPVFAATERVRVAPSQVAVRTTSHELYLEVEPLAGEGLLAFCRRVSGETASCREISRLNRNPRRLLRGVRYRVPYGLLAADLKLAVARALFRDDRAEPDAWVHRGGGESRADVALWFTGDSRRTDALLPAGRSQLAVGEEVRVAATALLPVFRAQLPPPAPARPPVATILVTPPSDEPAPLEYAEDAAGPFAIYRLRAGEALYSAVVVRLTGRDRAEDVNALATEIATRSGIPDVTDIPVGYPVRIPLELLLPQFLPANDPRRLEWEVERELAEQFRTPEPARRLAGVTVILDAGHGGADVGASRAGVWESIYVYDVSERIRRSLERRTLARVETTTRDGERRGPIERDQLPYSRGHAVLTTPPYPIADATIGVHLRWYLANSLFRRHAAGGDGDRVVFVSVHADSLHPSLRGATVYIPNTAGTAGTYGKQGGAFTSRREVREQQTVSYSLRERQKSAGRSRHLAERLVRGFHAHELAVHPFQPVRDRIFRGRRAWVPAVLRYNAVPAKVLLEVCNLANDEDRKLLQTLAFRDSIAEAVVDGILAFFDE